MQKIEQNLIAFDYSWDYTYYELLLWVFKLDDHNLERLVGHPKVFHTSLCFPSTLIPRGLHNERKSPHIKIIMSLHPFLMKNTRSDLSPNPSSIKINPYPASALCEEIGGTFYPNISDSFLHIDLTNYIDLLPPLK